MFTLELEDSIVINRPVEEVFAYMDDIDKEHEWQPYLKEWSQTPEQNGPGATPNSIWAGASPTNTSSPNTNRIAR